MYVASPQALPVIYPPNMADHALQQRAPCPQMFLGRRLLRTCSLSSLTCPTPTPSEFLPFLPAFPPALRFLCLGGHVSKEKGTMDNYNSFNAVYQPCITPHTIRPGTAQRCRNGSQSTLWRSKQALCAMRRPARAEHAGPPNLKLRKCARTWRW